MENLRFDAKDFEKTIMDAIQSELDEVLSLIETKKAIAGKRTEFEQKLKALEDEKAKLSKWDNLLEMSFESHKEQRNKLTDLENERNALISYSGSLTNGENECDKKFDPAKERLVKAFKQAVSSYVTKARIPIVEVIESILHEDDVCRKTVQGLYDKVCQDTGIKQYYLGFGVDTLMSNLYPIPSQKNAMETMIKDAKKALTT